MISVVSMDTHSTVQQVFISSVPFISLHFNEILSSVILKTLQCQAENKQEAKDRNSLRT